MHPISWLKYDPTPDGSSKGAEVKVSTTDVELLSFIFLQLPTNIEMYTAI